MKTLDIHTHLLSSEVKFDRFFDKFAINFFAKKFGLEAKELYENPYKAYKKGLINNLRSSKHVGKIALFGVDAKVNERGEILHKDKTVCATNDDVFEVYKENPGIIVPFFSINPLRPDALELIEKYHEKGFKGAKFLQNYWGVDTRKERFRPYFEKLKELNLPLIVHVGNENTIHSDKACEDISMLYHPLKVGVKTICAHMALGYDGNIFRAISKKPRNFNKEYHALLELLKTHDNLYADVSALLTPVRAKVLRHLSEQKEVHEKLLYGSDFPVPYSVIYNSYDLNFKKRLDLHKLQNPFDRYANGILEYFDEENPIWSNYKKLIAE
ncbi:amidohydrolase family protein [Campylobacter sp.]|uniref:amidohydrolase family protein n=1 Tax=Campylobacter sp. TaxID=205 RepID=UPI002700A3DE|nr:amidohydrolase family protein [Campylobacter sp.]